MPRIPDSYMLDTTSVDILNAILTEASPFYQSRVPEATRKNIRDVGAAILEIPTTRNEFVSALVNRIAMVVITSKTYSNPLKEFKQGMLELGESIEEIFVGIAKAHQYDPAVAESQVFKRETPDVNAIFHVLNYKTFYKTTVEKPQLEQAFLSISGVTDLIAKIVSQLYTGSELDDFLNMKNLIHQYGAMGQFYPVSITAVTDEATAKAAVKKIRGYVKKLSFMSNQYNAMHVLTHSQLDELILLVDPDFEATMDVDVLAAAFNMDKATFLSRVIVVDDFGGLTGVRAILCDKGWFKVYDRMLEMQELLNPEGLYWNYWLHVWRLYSYSPFHNAIAFVEAVPSVTSVAVSPAAATIAKGGSINLAADVVTVGYAPKSVNWSVSGEKSSITPDGLLTVAADEDEESLTVTATSVFDDTKTGTATITFPVEPG